MAQYGCQNFVACVGTWLQSNVWNHLSSGRDRRQLLHAFYRNLADWFHLHRTRDSDWWWATYKWGEVLIYFCFSWHPDLISVPAPLNEIVPLRATIWFLQGPFHPFHNKCHIDVFSHCGSQKLKAEHLSCCLFRSLTYSILDLKSKKENTSRHSSP